MVTINLTLNNFSELPVLLDFFARFGNDYEYTTRGIFRRKIPPACPVYGTPMVHNGYNSYTKQGPGETNIGRYKCSNCRSTQEENHSFWEDMKTLLFDSFNNFFSQVLRYHNVSYDGISAIMDFIYPRSRSTIFCYNGFHISKIKKHYFKSIQQRNGTRKCSKIRKYTYSAL